MNKFRYLMLLFVGILLYPKLAVAATLTFTPSSVTLATGQEQQISLVLEPEKAAVIGVDVMLRFDPQFVQVMAVEKTDAFAELVGKTIDNTNGTVRFSVINDYGVYQKHAGNIATITIKAKAETPQTALLLEFIGGKTRDSNVVTANGRDALTRVNAVSIQVTAAENIDSLSPSTTPAVSPAVLATKPSQSPEPVVSSWQPDVATAAGIVSQPKDIPKVEKPVSNPKTPITLGVTHSAIDGDTITWYFLGAVVALFMFIKLVSFLIAYGKSKLVLVVKM